MHRRQTTTGCALAAAAAPSPLPRFSEPGSPGSPVLDAGSGHRRTSSLGTIPLSSSAAGKPSRLGPSRTSEAGAAGASARHQTAAGSLSPASACTPTTAAKPAMALLRARSATDRPASWSIHAFEAGSTCSTPASCPGTPAAQAPAGAPDSACPSASSSSSTGQQLVTPRQQAAATPSPIPMLSTNQVHASPLSDRRQTVASGAITARPRSLLGRIRSLNAREAPASFVVEASSAGSTACSTPSACGSTAAGPATPPTAGPRCEPDHAPAAAGEHKQACLVALGQPCTALVLAPSVKALIVAQAPLGARQLAALPLSRGPTLDMELSPEEVLWVMQPPALPAAPTDVPLVGGRHGLLPRLLRRLLGRMSCMARPAVVG